MKPYDGACAWPCALYRRCAMAAGAPGDAYRPARPPGRYRDAGRPAGGQTEGQPESIPARQARRSQRIARTWRPLRPAHRRTGWSRRRMTCRAVKRPARISHRHGDRTRRDESLRPDAPWRRLSSSPVNSATPQGRRHAFPVRGDGTPAGDIRGVFGAWIAKAVKGPGVTGNGREADTGHLIERSGGGSVPGLHSETPKVA